jgi:hypothetical protein
MAEGNADRWTTLSNEYKKVIEKGGEDRFINWRLANHIRDGLAESCGCEATKVIHYKYSDEYPAEYAAYTRVDQASDAVIATEHGWTIGIGVELEIAPDTYPKTIFVWPVDVSREGDEITLESRMMHDPVSFNLRDGKSYTNGIKAACDQMYFELTEALKLWAMGGQRPKRIGFG